MIDPWGGSYYVERLTHELALRRWAHIQEVEELGGMTKAIEPGCPSCASRKRPRGRRRGSIPGQQTIVGVNKYRLDKEDHLEVLEVDNTAVRQAQIARLASCAPSATRRR